MNPKIFGVRRSQDKVGTVVAVSGSSYTVQWDGLEEDAWNPGQMVAPTPMPYERIELIAA